MMTCVKDKKIQRLKDKKQLFISHGRLDLAQKTENMIKSISMKGVKEIPLIELNMPKEEDLYAKTYKRYCHDCGNKIISTFSTRKQKCIYCKIKDKSVGEAKKCFDLLLNSDIFVEKNE